MPDVSRELPILHGEHTTTNAHSIGSQALKAFSEQNGGQGENTPPDRQRAFNSQDISEAAAERHEAVADTYVAYANQQLELVPTDKLDIAIKATHGLESTPGIIAAARKAAEAYVYPTLIMPSEVRPISINPFGHAMPKNLQNFYAWVRERGEKQSTTTRQLGGQSYDIYPTRLEDAYIRTIWHWHAYYVGFLELLNVPDSAGRLVALAEHNQHMFGKPLGYANKSALVDDSPFESPQQWTVYSVLNVLLNPEPRISPTARIRAIALLGSMPEHELGTSAMYHTKRASPLQGLEDYFRERYLRIPSRFLEPEERARDRHPRWQHNPVIAKLFGAPTKDKALEYDRIFNELTTEHPDEALQVTLLMLLGSHSAKHQAAAFKALVHFPELDIGRRYRIFDRRASYMELLGQPIGDKRIVAALNIPKFDLSDIPPEGLEQTDLVRLATLMRTRVTELETELIEEEREVAAVYFTNLDTAAVDSIDPLGYYRLFGIRPDGDRPHFDKKLMRAY